jgi:hypothetical protein
MVAIIFKYQLQNFKKLNIFFTITIIKEIMKNFYYQNILENKTIVVIIKKKKNFFIRIFYKLNLYATSYIPRDFKNHVI